MRPNATRVLLAVALAATLQWARTPVFATQRARSGHMTRRRVADELSPVLNAMQDQNFQAAVTSAWVFVQSTLTPAAELVQSLGQVQEFARTWGEQEPFEGKDADKHVEELTGAIEKTIAAGKNVLIPTAQDADLPLEPIRGTPFEKLMVATLQNTSMAGVYALHAEPGAGKSTAATLETAEGCNRCFAERLGQATGVFLLPLQHQIYCGNCPPLLHHVEEEGDQTEVNS